jgi:uncharacterized protein with HEPN domain
VSEASRRLPDDLKARHPAIPWKRIAGIGNVRRHDYDVVEPDILLATAVHDLPALYRVCRTEIDALQTPEPGRDIADDPFAVFDEWHSAADTDGYREI